MDSQYLPLGCYGKLPFWPEYLSAGPPARLAAIFRDWLHAGCAGASAEASGRVRFVIGDHDAGELMAGVLRPSGDQGGLRSFPFAVHVTFPRHALAKRYTYIVAGMDRVWDALDDAWGGLAAISNPGAFQELVSSIRVPLPRARSETKPAYELATASSADRVFGADPASGPGPLAEGLPRAIRGIRALGADRSLQLAFPVGARLDDAAFDAAFWVDLVERQFLWRRPEPSVFLDAEPGRTSRGVHLVYGPLASAGYARVVQFGTENGAVHHPARSPGGGLAGSGGAPTLRQILAHRFPKT